MAVEQLIGASREAKDETWKDETIAGLGAHGIPQRSGELGGGPAAPSAVIGLDEDR